MRFVQKMALLTAEDLIKVESDTLAYVHQVRLHDQACKETRF